MRKFLSILLLALFTAAFMTACGGGGGGGGEEGPPPATTVTDGTFSKTVVAGGAPSTFNNILSLTTVSVRYMLLYLPTDINGAGNITSIALSNNASSPAGGAAVTCPNLTVRMGLTSSATLTTTYASNVENGKGTFATVLDGAALSIPSTAGGSWTTINLSTPFYYNGVDNLVVDISRAAACSGTVYNDVHAPTTVYNPVVYNTTTNVAATVAACNDVVDMKFSFSGGVDTVDNGGTSSNFWPLANNPPDGARAQYLYLADEINGSGPITGLALQVNMATSTTNTYTATIKLAHSLSTSLTMTWANNYAGTPTTVANEVTFTVPNGLSAGDYFWVPIPNGTFTYDGTRNLLVDIDVSAGTGDTYLRYTSIAGRRVAGYHTDGAVATGGGQTQLPNIALRFKGGTMDVIGAGNSFANVFTSGASGRQFLLVASDLGTAGTINKLACRADSTTTAGDYSNFTVTLAHTTQSALVATDATNIAGGTVVFNGTFSMPAGLLEGDWVEIPFTTSFSYNGIDNLVVQTSSGGGSTTQNCIISGPDAARYTGRWKATGGGSPLDYSGVFRFWVN